MMEPNPRREWQIEYYAKNREKILAQNKEWRKRNRDRVNANKRLSRKRKSDRASVAERLLAKATELARGKA